MAGTTQNSGETKRERADREYNGWQRSKQLPYMYSDHSVEPRDKVVCKKCKTAMDLSRFVKSRLGHNVRRPDGIGYEGGREQGMAGKLMRGHKA